MYNLKISVCNKIRHSTLNMAFCVRSYNEPLSWGVRSLTFVLILRPPKYSNLLFGKDTLWVSLSLLKAIFLKSHKLSVDFTHHANGFYKYSDRWFFSKLSSKERIRLTSSDYEKGQEPTFHLWWAPWENHWRPYLLEFSVCSDAQNIPGKSETPMILLNIFRRFTL